MKILSFLKRLLIKCKYYLKAFLIDNYGGNLVEYALLIRLALFIFFIIVGFITSLLDWPLELINNLFEGNF